MRKYSTESKEQLTGVVCNGCGKELKVERGFLKEGCYASDALFGYFSQRDGIRHRFDLCEECYDRLIAGFVLPAEAVEEIELL